MLYHINIVSGIIHEATTHAKQVETHGEFTELHGE